MADRRIVVRLTRDVDRFVAKMQQAERLLDERGGGDGAVSGPARR